MQPFVCSRCTHTYIIIQDADLSIVGVCMTREVGCVGASCRKSRTFLPELRQGAAEEQAVTGLWSEKAPQSSEQHAEGCLHGTHRFEQKI